MKRMTPSSFALVFAGACLNSALAAEPGVTFDCASLRLPRMTDVSIVTGIGNFSQAYATRELLLHQATRICRNPAIAFVRFVPDSQVAVAPLRTVVAR